MNFDEFNKNFYYDPTSPTCLRWAIWNGQSNYSRRDIGDIAGSLIRNPGGRIQSYRVSFKNKAKGVHRIIWEIFNEEIPSGMIIDHLNGNPLDNRIENLKCKTQKHNSQNKTLNSRNKTGFPGVSWTIVKGGKYTYADARVLINGKCKRKLFSVDKLGEIQALMLAVEWRESAIVELNMEGEDYIFREPLKYAHGAGASQIRNELLTNNTIENISESSSQG